MKRRTLYLPIGTKCRELFGKALLAARAVERGWRVLLGSLDIREEMLEDLAPGLLIENNIPEDKADRFHRLKERGYVIANLSEESALYRDAEEYWTHRIGCRALESAEVIFTVGARSERDIRAHRPAAADRMVLTGNPRFDTLLPGVRTVYDAEAEAIRGRHGRFLLVNSNFGPANPHKTGLDVVAQWRRDGKLTTEAQIDRKRREIAYKTRQMIDLQALLAKVARAGVFDRIIVRPASDREPRRLAHVGVRRERRGPIRGQRHPVAARGRHDAALRLHHRHRGAAARPPDRHLRAATPTASS